MRRPKMMKYNSEIEIYNAKTGSLEFAKSSDKEASEFTLGDIKEFNYSKKQIIILIWAIELTDDNGNVSKILCDVMKTDNARIPKEPIGHITEGMLNYILHHWYKNCKINNLLH